MDVLDENTVKHKDSKSGINSAYNNKSSNINTNQIQELSKNKSRPLTSKAVVGSSTYKNSSNSYYGKIGQDREVNLNNSNFPKIKNVNIDNYVNMASIQEENYLNSGNSIINKGVNNNDNLNSNKLNRPLTNKNFRNSNMVISNNSNLNSNSLLIGVSNDKSKENLNKFNKNNSKTRFSAKTERSYQKKDNNFYNGNFLPHYNIKENFNNNNSNNNFNRSNSLEKAENNSSSDLNSVILNSLSELLLNFGGIFNENFFSKIKNKENSSKPNPTSTSLRYYVNNILEGEEKNKSKFYSKQNKNISCSINNKSCFNTVNGLGNIKNNKVDYVERIKNVNYNINKIKDRISPTSKNKQYYHNNKKDFTNSKSSSIIGANGQDTFQCLLSVSN
jgi:hypothetical protein